MRAIAFTLGLLILLLSIAAQADSPGLINYQGTLTDECGAAMDTTVSIAFSIYTDSTEGTLVWSETQPVVYVSHGIFNVLLGRVNAISDTVFKDPSRWLGVQVGADPELMPRQRIAAGGYAFWAAEADTAEYARGAPAVSDGDWTISGDDIYHQVGNVGIGTTTPGASLEVVGSGIANHLMLTNITSVGPAIRLNAANRDWVIMGSNPGSSVGDQKLVFRDYSGAQDRMVIDQVGNVGIGTKNPAAKLDVHGTLNVGQDDTGHDVNFYGTNSGSRLFWDESKMALRAGQALSGQWDDANVGSFSFAVGDNPIASGNYSVAMGYGPSAGGFGATATGWLANAGGYVSTAMGSYATSAGPWSVAVGKYVMADSSEAFVLGSGISLIDPLINDIKSSLMVGFNDTTATLFVGGPNARVGIGTDRPVEKLDVAGTVQVEGFKLPTGASDGYVLTADPSGIGSWQPLEGDGDWTISGNHMHSAVPGSVGIGTMSPAAKLDIQGTLRVGIDGSGYDVTFLGEESGGGLIWDQAQMALRAGRDDDGTHWLPDSIGQHSLATGLNTRASGHASTALGNETIASGPQATALGTFSVATGGHSLASGFGSEASGLTSTAMGCATNATGSSSTAMGSHTTASELAATAMGSSTTASGVYSTAMGAATTASGYSSTAMGLYAAAMGSTSVAIGGYLRAGSSNTIVLGSGKSNIDRLNNYVPNSLMVGFDTTSATLFVGGNHHRMGVGTEEPATKLDVRGTFNVGVDNTGYDVNFYGANSGSRFFWDESRMALRAGRDTDGTHWTSDSVGVYSVALGYNTRASGIYSVVAGGALNSASNDHAIVGGGYDNHASGDLAIAVGGWDNNASGYGSFVGGGYDNLASDYFAVVPGGMENTASGQHATVSGGLENLASGYAAIVACGYEDTSAADFSFTTGFSSKVDTAYASSAAFNGQHATASGQTRVGAISKTSGTFTIDHPLDPMNRILNHYFVESPEMVLIYRGVARIGSDGRAEVHLPEYFAALNRNPMIQLTGIGTSDVYVAEKVTGNRFAIGGTPGTEVYWTVTGERQDPSAEITKILMPVEQFKEGSLPGHSLDDDFLAATMQQLERMGRAGQFSFRTHAGRETYEASRRVTNVSPPVKPRLEE